MPLTGRAAARSFWFQECTDQQVMAMSQPGTRNMLLDVRELLTPADNQTHRRYSFRVPPDCTELQFRIRYTPKLAPARVPNLLTISLDDAEASYRGAGHRQANDQRLLLGLASASPGLVAGPLPEGA